MLPPMKMRDFYFCLCFCSCTETGKLSQNCSLLSHCRDADWHLAYADMNLHQLFGAFSSSVTLRTALKKPTGTRFANTRFPHKDNRLYF